MRSVQLRGVTRSFGDTPVLTGVDLDVGAGECVALLGASGSGKSTLLRLICGLDPVDGGEIRIGDDVVAGGGRHVVAERRDVGMVFQDGALFPFLDVTRNVGFGLARGERRGGRRIAEMLELVGLPDHGGRDPATLSGGERQRVALARALAPEPGVVLLDEPLSNLDADLRAHLRAEIRRIVSESGVTTVIVTHDRDEAFELGDRVAVLHGGRIVAVGPPEELYESPPDDFVARTTGDVYLVAVQVEGGRVVTPWGEVDPGSPVTGAGPWRLLVRPEHLELGSAGDGSAGVVAGRVTRVAYEGSTTLVEVDSDDGERVGVRHLGPPRVATGESVTLRRRDLPPTLLGPRTDQAAARSTDATR